MRAHEVVVFLVLSTITLALLGFALLYPGTSPSGGEIRPRHVYRLPKGAKHKSGMRWTWANETVFGIFDVYTGAGSMHTGHNPVAGQCCSLLDGRLFATESYELEAANDGSFPASTVSAIFADAASRWEAVIGNHFGAQSAISESAGLVFNGRNQIGLGELDVDVSGALAVTGLWMTCPGGGSVSTCSAKLEIVEWDQTYAITGGLAWGVSGESDAYDLASVVVHEFGHNVGLGDLSADACEPSTMYGYAAKGETLRKSIDAITVACAKDHYGLPTSAATTPDWQKAMIVLLIGILF